MVSGNKEYWSLKQSHCLIRKLRRVGSKKKAVEDATAEVEDAKMLLQVLATQTKGCWQSLED